MRRCVAVTSHRVVTVRWKLREVKPAVGGERRTTPVCLELDLDPN